MRIGVVLPAVVATIGLVAVAAAGSLALRTYGDFAAARTSGRAVQAFGTVLKAWERQQLERRAVGIGLSLAEPDLPAAVRAGAATDAAFAAAEESIASLVGNSAPRSTIAEARTRLAAARTRAFAELSKPLQERSALASSTMLRDFNRVQLAMNAPATAAESAAGRAEPAMAQVVMIARISAALREALGARSTLLSLHLSGKRLEPTQLVEATEYTGQIFALWERIGVAIEALGYPPALAAAVAEAERTLVGIGEPAYRSLLDQARSGTGPPAMSFAEFRPFTEPMLAQALTLRDAALREALRMSSERERAALVAMLLSLGAAAVAVTVMVASVVIVLFGVVRPLARVAATVGELADGNLDDVGGGQQRTDEIGLVARAIATLRERLLAARDMQAQLDRLAVEEAARLRQFADSAMEGLVIHRQGQVLDANQATSDLVGVPASDMRGAWLSELFPDLPRLAPDDEAQGRRTGETEIRAATGELIPVEVLTRSLLLGGQATQVTAIRDLTERRKAEQRIRHLAHHDGLTGLANRVLLSECLDRALDRAGRGESGLAVLYLDLDRFKPVNDTHGHAVGDLLLRAVAERLRGATRSNCEVVARIGGDEFVVVEQVGTAASAAALATRIVDVLSQPYRLRNLEIAISASVGVACYPAQGVTADELLQSADAALYRSKTAGPVREAVAGRSIHGPPEG